MSGDELVGFFRPPAKGEDVPAVIASARNKNATTSVDVKQQQQAKHKRLVYSASGAPESNYDLDDPENVAERSSRNVTYKDLPRLIPRSLAFDQSENIVRVFHNHKWRIFFLLRHDWFHAGLRFPTLVSAFVLLSLWTVMIIIFAAIYVAIDNNDPDVECGLGKSGFPIEFGAAFSFSLETCTTVGYTLPYGVNSFFEGNCPALIIAIYFQMIWSMMFNAFLFAFFYNRLGRSESRGAQVVMSSKAIVNISHGGQVRFQVRIFDVDASHPVVEAHVRLYVVNKNRPVPRPLRVLQPNDELGAALILSLPTVVVHHIDAYSILHPPSEHQPLHAHGLVLRQADSYTCNREEFVCPICGEAYGTFDRWIRHVRYQQMVEKKENYPIQGSHLSLTDDDLAPPKAPTTDLQELQDYFRRELSEVVCVVEGIDPLTSGTFQGLQSYKLEDIIWDEYTQFAPCLTIDAKKNFVVDLDKFHDTMRIERPKSFRINNSNTNICSNINNCDMDTSAMASGYTSPTNQSNDASGDGGGGNDVAGGARTSSSGSPNNNNNNIINSTKSRTKSVKQRSANVHDSLIRALEADSDSSD